MKKFIAILIIAISCCMGWSLYSWNTVEKTVAQTIGPDEQKKHDWDKSVTEEKLERLRKESRELQESIKQAVATNYPKLKIKGSYFSDPANSGLGRKGQSEFSASWEQKHVEYSIAVTLTFSPEEAVKFHTMNVDAYQLPEVYPAPEFLGKPAALFKNLVYNKTMTSVSISFVRGRLKIHTQHRNHRQTANQNEKDIIEFVRVIEPVLKAKLNFEEV